jgi:uncharacterized protein (DUF488 family)
VDDPKFDARPLLYTIGHSNLSIDDFVEALRSYGIRGLVDVRSAPYSQFCPQFNRENLDRALQATGIVYRFAGELLGGRPTDPTCYKDGNLPDRHANYLELVDYDEVARRPWFKKGVERLLDLARQEPTAMMCSEEDPKQCHRYHLIAQAILGDIRILDIRTGGGGGLRLTEATRKPRQAMLI